MQFSKQLLYGAVSTLILGVGTLAMRGNDSAFAEHFLLLAQTSTTPTIVTPESNTSVYENIRKAIMNWLNNQTQNITSGLTAVEEVPGGLNYELYQITTPRRIPVMPSNVAELIKEGVSAKIDLTESTLSDYMAMRFEGFVTTPSEGSYTFALYSDEGSKMWIDDQLVVNNDGVHTAKNKASSPVTLSKGEHKIKVEYFELVGSQTLKAYRKGPDFATQEIPSSALRPKTSTVSGATCTLSANAGVDKVINLPTNTVTLEGSGTCARNYNWSKISGPAGETIVSHMSATTNVTNLAAGTYVFRLKAIDTEGYVQSDDVQVIVNSSTSTTNIRPTSDAGSDQTITLPTSSVTVNGIANDADGTVVSNTRRQVSGPTKASITSFTSRTTTITNLSVAGTYIFWFNVTDNKEAGASDEIQITVRAADVGTANIAPVVSAGADKVITLPTSSVAILGTANDPDGTIASVVWTKISGPSSFTISSPNALATNISNLAQGSYVFRVTVTDNNGATASDDVQVTVNSQVVTCTLSANAGADKVINLPTNTVTLEGSGTCARNYNWSKISGPAGETIVSHMSATTNVTNLAAGTYVFRLKAIDTEGYVQSDDVQVIVNSANAGTANLAPTVNAGADKVIALPTSSVAILGTANDPDGTIASVVWTKISGPSSFTISSPNALATNISNMTTAGIYIFRITVTDNNGATASDDIQVTVNPGNVTPTANAGADKVITLPTSSVAILGTANDPDGTIASVAWTKVSGPTTYTISNLNTLATNINDMTTAGTYVFRLTVTDNNGTTASDDVQVTVNSASNTTPTVNAGADKVITLPTTTVALGGTANDPDGTIASIAWTKVSGPSSTIGSPNALATSISNMSVAGIYIFRLTVTDNNGATASDDIQVTVNPVVYTPIATATHYASPLGGGDGKSINSPFRISDFRKVAKPGDILGLVDGVYKGADSMIEPPYGLSGLPGKPITVRALNDGKVEIDGEKLRGPVSLEENDWFVIEGVNAHDAGGSSYSESVFMIRRSDNVLVLRAVGRNARGDSNIFRNWGGSGVEFRDTVGFGTARKIYSTSQGSYNTTFTRTFGSRDNNINIGPKETYSLSYNSWNTTCQNCIASWYGQQMPESYEARETDGSMTNQFFTNYTVQAPQGLFSADSFDVTPDVANIKILGSIAYLKGNNRFHNTTRDWAGPYGFGIKGVIIDNSIAYIEPGSKYSNIRTMTLHNDIGGGALNRVKNSTMIGGDRTHIGSEWGPQNMYSSANCDIVGNGGSIVNPKIPTAGGANIMYRYENGVLTDKPLRPWPMNQRAIDAMTRAGFEPIDITRTIFGLCNGTIPPEVEAALNNTSIPANLLPVVSAGIDKVVTLPTNTVSVIGTANDVDGTIASKVRTKISGPTIYTINSPSSLTTDISNLVAGTYVFRLTVTDNGGASSYDDVQVVVNPAPNSNLSPNVNAGADKNITLPTNSVDLVGTVTDSDGTIASTAWTKLSGPAGATINSANTLSTSVTNLIQGVYVFRLTATDDDGASTSDDIQVVVNPAPTTGATGINDIATLAKQWLTASPSQRATIEPQLAARNTNIDQAFALVKPHVFTETAVGEVFYQNFKRPDLRAKYPDQIYHMHIPVDYTPSKKKKLVIREHGGGSCDPMSQEADHLALFDMDNEKVTGRSALRTEIDDSDYILVAAVAPCGSLLPHPGHASRRDVPVDIPYLQDLITDVGERYNIDRNNIVIAGFSMGGIGAGYASLALNDRRAAALISARSRNMGPRRALTDMPTYIIQGQTDAYFNSTSDCRPHRTAGEYSTIVYDILNDYSNIHSLNMYPGGHGRDSVGEAAGRNFLDGKQGWVTTKVRNPYRSHVNAVSRRTTYMTGSNFNVSWTAPKTPKTMRITINQISSGTIAYDYARQEGNGMCTSEADRNNWDLYRDTIQVPAGHVEANVAPNNQINITTRNVKNFSVWVDPRMGLDLSQPITLVVNGTSIQRSCSPSLLTALKSYEASKDRSMTYNCIIENIVVPGT